MKPDLTEKTLPKISTHRKIIKYLIFAVMIAICIYVWWSYGKLYHFTQSSERLYHLYVTIHSTLLQCQIAVISLYLIFSIFRQEGLIRSLEQTKGIEGKNVIDTAINSVMPILIQHARTLNANDTIGLIWFIVGNIISTTFSLLLSELINLDNFISYGMLIFNCGYFLLSIIQALHIGAKDYMNNSVEHSP